MEFRQEQMKRCMKCQYAKEQLRKILVYEDARYTKQYIAEHSQYFELQGKVKGGTEQERLKEKLERIEDRFLNYKNLENEELHVDPELDVCFKVLHRIYYFLKPVFEEKYFFRDGRYMPQTKSILLDMLEENYQYGKLEIEQKMKNPVYGEYVEQKAEHSESINKFDRLFKECADEEPTQELQNLIETMQDIVKDFCEIEYTPEIIGKMKKDRGIVLSKDECFLPTFRSLVEQHVEADAMFLQFQERVNALPQRKQKVMCEFLKEAPKSFGYAMTAVMHQEGQELSAQDVLKLVEDCRTKEGTKIGISHIQSLMKCKKPEKNVELIPFICRALLVEESVLLRGYGAAHGSWSFYLSNEFVKSYNSIDGRENKLAPGREEIRKLIRNIISDEESLQDYLRKIEQNPDSDLYKVHKKTEITIYETMRDQFCNLIEPESAYALLRVLEKTSDL